MGLSVSPSMQSGVDVHSVASMDRESFISDDESSLGRERDEGDEEFVDEVADRTGHAILRLGHGTLLSDTDLGLFQVQLQRLREDRVLHVLSVGYHQVTPRVPPLTLSCNCAAPYLHPTLAPHLSLCSPSFPLTHRWSAHLTVFERLVSFSAASQTSHLTHMHADFFRPHTCPQKALKL
jgi:hypothetical protein